MIRVMQFRRVFNYDLAESRSSRKSAIDDVLPTFRRQYKRNLMFLFFTLLKRLDQIELNEPITRRFQAKVCC